MKFQLDALLSEANMRWKKHLEGVTIKLPFVSFKINPDDIEKEVAREILIRLPDKRVLSSKECCDNCIRNSVNSLQEIRKIIVDSQVKLSKFHDGGMYLLLEMMAEAIRQFVTFEEGLNSEVENRFNEKKEQYFQILNQLRFHFYSCLKQISAIAGMTTPKVESYLKSSEDWELSFYEKPTFALENSHNNRLHEDT